MTKRSRIVALGATMALSLSAVGGAAVHAQDEEMEPVRIGFVTHVLGNPFIQQIVEAAEFAADDLGVNLEVQGPAGGTPEEQIALIQGFANAGVDGIATSVPGSTLAAKSSDRSGRTPVVR